MTDLFRGLLNALRAFAFFIGRINGVILLSISFYLLLFPMGALRRLFTRQQEPTGWLKKDPLPRNHFEKQY